MKKKKLKKSLTGFVLPALAGMALGFAAAYLGFEVFGGFKDVLLLLAALVVSFFVHMVLHEGGHLVCGLLSGYKFVSFRAGNMIWVKQGDRIVLKRFNIPGTGGQCLLDPPNPDESGRYPNVLYNLGGGLSNLLWSFLALAALGLFAEGVMARSVLVAFALAGIYLGITNLVPLKAGGIANDGYNLRAFLRNPESGRALWLQLRINKLEQTDGLRLCEIPEEYFHVSKDDRQTQETGPGSAAEVEPDGGADPLKDAIELMYFQRLLDQKRFDEAASYGEKLAKKRDLLPIYRNILEVERLFLELIGPCRAEAVERMYTKPLQKYLKMVKGYPSTHRVLCAYGTRFAHDDAMAEREQKAFEKVIKSYPTPGEIRTERELMEVLTWKEKKN